MWKRIRCDNKMAQELWLEIKWGKYRGIFVFQERYHSQPKSQTMDFVDMAICHVVCRKSDIHGKSDFPNSQKLDSLQITANKIQAKTC
jgi:hypothetical protein